MDSVSRAGLVLGLILILSSNIPILWLCFRPQKSPRRKKVEHRGYQDEDGETSESSTGTLDDIWAKTCIIMLSVVGFSCVSATVVVSASQKSDRTVLLWTLFASWTMTSFQSFVFFAEKSLPRRFSLSLYAFWTSLGLLVLTVFDRALWSARFDKVLFALYITNGVIAGLRAACCLLIPRRPKIFFQGRSVDQEYTVGLWSQLTFGYITSFVRSASQSKSHLDVEDVPELPFRVRSEYLHDTLQQAQQRRQSLFRALREVHFRSLSTQWILSFGWGLLSFGPLIALFGILKSLEDHSTGNPGIWIAALGTTMLISSSMSTWLWCVTYSRVSIPIYSELVALLFAKSMRRKDIQRVRDTKTISSSSQEQENEQDQQEAVNLVTIDTKRVSDFASYSHLIPSSVTQFIIACLLLIGLIGWQALLAGLAANLIVSPFNFLIAKRYRGFQIGLMQARDQRTSVVHEMIKNIRQVKFSSTESFWEERVLDARKHELRCNLKGCLYETGFQAMWTLAPLLLSAVSLTVFALENGRLTASVAFTAISIFGSLEVSLAALPHLIATALEAKSSIDRIDEYIQSPDKPPAQSHRDNDIVFDDATVTWPVSEGSKGVFELSSLKLKLPPHGLTVITGRTGCGKSLLLSSLLGECDIVAGQVRVPSSGRESCKYPPTNREDWIIDTAIAYVPQNPWVENGTISDNIVFNLPLDQRRYQEVLFASGLEKDLKILSDGDQTDIGANGINLSGGQRARISFARALYSRAGILIMDDVFSALDADTGLHLYKYGLTGDLACNRTRILATHHVALCLPKTDYCVVLGDGKVACAGSVNELKGKDTFAQYMTGGEQIDGNNKSSQSFSQDALQSENETTETQKFTPDEQRASGSVSLTVYRKFIAGDRIPWFWLLGVLTALLYMLFFFGRSAWLMVWTGAESRSSDYTRFPIIVWHFATGRIRHIQKVQTPPDLGKYIGIYVGISFAASLMATLRFFFIRIATIYSSQALFENLLSTVLSASLRWVDTVPLGRVLNRFTSDIYTLDHLIGSDLKDLLDWALKVLGILAACLVVSPVVLIPAALLLVLSIWPSILYLRAAREVKRLESVCRSPILEQFTSSLVGLSTIRAFDQTRKYTEGMFMRIDAYSKVSRNLYLLNWWLQIRINLSGAIFSIIVAILVMKFNVPAAKAGLAISLLLQYSTSVSSAIRYYANFEMDMNAAERVIEYTGIDQEPQDGNEPPAAWPTHGRIEVENLVISYSPELSPVLNGLTFTVESNERVGVVGRTGSGKSTLALALFRFMEASEGRVMIDGLDTSQLKLLALRRALAIVPQSPTLFTGTIRSNLDPFDKYSETDLADALRRVHLVNPDEALPTNTTAPLFSLSAPVSEGGSNFSQGQRQLLCLARAILQAPKIMILDEATSAVDMKTDRHIQEAIRSEFGCNATSLLVIAHRLSTIADFDRILVMDDGKIVENGTPKKLLGIKGGVFQELVNQSGEKSFLEEIILGRRGE